MSSESGWPPMSSSGGAIRCEWTAAGAVEDEGDEGLSSGCAARKLATTEWICVASSLQTSVSGAARGGGRRTDLVGEMMMAPISFLPSCFSRPSSFSNTGMTKASVFPEPVTA